MIGKTVECLRTMRARGTGPAYFKIGGTVLFDPNDVDRYIESCRVKTRDCP